MLDHYADNRTKLIHGLFGLNKLNHFSIELFIARLPVYISN